MAPSATFGVLRGPVEPSLTVSLPGALGDNLGCLLQQKIWNNQGVKTLTVSCLFLLNLLVAEETHVVWLRSP